MIGKILPYCFIISLQFLELRLNWNREIIFVILLHLHDHTDGHSFSCEGHPHDLVQEWT